MKHIKSWPIISFSVSVNWDCPKVKCRSGEIKLLQYKKKKKKQTHIFSGSESVKQSSLQSKSSRLRTWLFLVMVPFGGFPGGNHADSSGLFRCRLRSLISLLTCTSPSSTRDQLWRRWRNRFSLLSSAFALPQKKRVSGEWKSRQDEDLTFIRA